MDCWDDLLALAAAASVEAVWATDGACAIETRPTGRAVAVAVTADQAAFIAAARSAIPLLVRALRGDSLVCPHCRWERPLDPDEPLDYARADLRTHLDVYHAA